MPNSIKYLSQLLETKYGIQGSLRKLAGYQDINHLVTTPSGDKFILKITFGEENLDFIQSQNRILSALARTPAGDLLPIPLTTINEQLFVPVIMDGLPGYARLFSFIEGRFLAEVTPDITFYSDLGKVFAQIDEGMEGLEDAVLKSHTHDWDLARVMEVSGDVHLIEDSSDCRLVNYFLMKYREEVIPEYFKLPKFLIHSDGNDWNVLTSEDPLEKGRHRVAGVIDFGDMVWGARIQELAIVLAYAMMDRKDFLQVYNKVISGYQEIIKLTGQEISLLYYMVAARWCQTLVMAARQEKANPGSAYHQVSVSGARNMLRKWIGQNPSGMIPPSTENNHNQSAASLAHDRYGYFSRAVSLSYEEPIQMTGAAMQYMYSADGRTYLDCVNNIPHVGHCHPKVVEAGQRQMARINTNTRYLYDSLDRYAKKLLSRFPSTLNKVFFVNSGSAATDLAVRLAEKHTVSSEFVVLDYAYHGNTRAAIGLSPYKFNRKGGMGKPENVTILKLVQDRGDLPPAPSLERRGSDLPPAPSLERRGGDLPPAPSLERGGRRTFFAESIVGCAGQIVLSKELMQQTVRDIRASGGIYVADEVQTGFGRIGSGFWAYELYDVVPDMVILGKPMGNGHPMGAVVCTEEIARSFETGMEFFSSFGGNPVSCEIGLAVLEVIEEENLQENARRVGEYLKGRLNSVFGNDPVRESLHQAAPARRHLCEVRGSGLFLGIELNDTETGLPSTELAIAIVGQMKEMGFLLSTDGPFNNVIKIKPPMCFSQENAEELADNIQSVYKKLI